MITLKFEGEVKRIEFKGTLKELVNSMGLYTPEVVVKVNGKITPETYKLKGDEEVEVIQVVYD